MRFCELTKEDEASLREQLLRLDFYADGCTPKLSAAIYKRLDAIRKILDDARAREFTTRSQEVEEMFRLWGDSIDRFCGKR